MHVLQAQDDAADEKLDNVFRKGTKLADLIAKVSSGHKIHDQVQVIPILERIDHIDQEWVPQICKQLSLVLDGLDALFRDNPEWWNTYTVLDISFIA